MKKVSLKFVFCRGVCQALGWFFGLFGYKRDGKFAKCAWGLFAAIVTLFVIISSISNVYMRASTFYYRHYRWKARVEENGGHYVSHRIGYINPFYDENGYLIDKVTGKEVLNGIKWISMPLGNADSLVAYSNGKKRGYFNMYTGLVEIPAKFDHAWIFSEGIASVEENGVVKFIDKNGNQVFERTFAYDPEHTAYVFHGGYCIVDNDHDSLYGLIDRNGEMVLEEIYNDITVSNNLCYWTLRVGDESEVLDKDLNPVLPMMPADIWVRDDEITVTMQDNTMRKYDLQGNLISDFYIRDFEYLEYEHVCDTIHKTARAHLCRYTGGNGMEGLMTAEGHMISLPIYQDITAIGPDTYLCTVSYGDKEIVDGKGQKVR